MQKKPKTVNVIGRAQSQTEAERGEQNDIESDNEMNKRIMVLHMSIGERNYPSDLKRKTATNPLPPSPISILSSDSRKLLKVEEILGTSNVKTRRKCRLHHQTTK